MQRAEELSIHNWKPGTVPASNILSQSDLFSVLIPKLASNRPFHNDECVLKRSEIILRHKGEMLFQFDWDVFHALICLSQGRLDQWHDIEIAEVIEILGIHRNGRNYEMFKASLKRLDRTFVKLIRINTESDKEIESTDWIQLVSYSEEVANQSVRFLLPSTIKCFYAESGYEFLQWNIRNQLKKNELARKVMCLCDSETNHQFFKATELKENYGYTGTMANFTRLLAKALDALFNAGAIKGYWIEKPKLGNADQKLVYIWKKRVPSSKQLNKRCLRGTSRFLTQE